MRRLVVKRSMNTIDKTAQRGTRRNTRSSGTAEELAELPMISKRKKVTGNLQCKLPSRAAVKGVIVDSNEESGESENELDLSKLDIQTGGKLAGTIDVEKQSSNGASSIVSPSNDESIAEATNAIPLKKDVMKLKQSMFRRLSRHRCNSHLYVGSHF
mmetsp:Transcript_22558/g.49195  ORF Transcript_22558/g.49195 Transcript_22558/m.49195 type:complete len:157 (-) Transcript_22558:1641-2111(-)